MSWRDELVRRFPRLEVLPADAYVVGGAIRDLLLEREPADVDVACLDARACAERISSRVIRLGTEEHLSAWRVVDGDHIYDFADLLDGAIGPDLARRDFTVNAMAVKLGSGELLDHHGSQRDLGARVVRMINASNFDDDPLRCLKAVRMATVLGFEIEPLTVAAIRARAAKVSSIAAERVTYELSVIFSAGRFRRAVALLHESGLDEPLFGRALDSGAYHADDVTLAGAMALLVDEPGEYGKRWRWGAALRREAAALQLLLPLSGDHRVELYEAG
ncbi:MAG: CCA tRNA nucleotidyltransferase, partial [Thermoanaerobaculia bacterium]|nr:CCA tRNA nucleotidyltransferase [Thermoanaerobaculia bacterium]